ncbi:MAG: PD40 domain-containing protein [bacterium]|nr:PD40 domain-containing protein [bacterium]
MRMQWLATAMVVGLGVLVAAGTVDAKPGREPHKKHKPREPRAPKPPKEPKQPRTPTKPSPDDGRHGASPANVHFVPAGTVAIPGRGLTVSWSPDGGALAVGGRFRDKATRLRYDTRIVDVASKSLVKSFACHYFWVVATDWTDNPFLGEVIADGGGDHAVKLWDAAGQGSSECKPGQMPVADGGIRQMGQINGWITSLAFSPDGRWLAGTGKDRTVRVWQIAPGKHQWKVVLLWTDKNAGSFLSVRWAPDGRALVTGDRKGRVAVWDVDLDGDRWDDATIASFAASSWASHASWFSKNKSAVARTPRWLEGGHGAVWNVRWQPGGDRVAAVGTDGTLSVLAAASGAVVWRSGPPRASALHGLDWSPDGNLLAAAGADRRIYLYAAEDGAPYDVLTGHADLVTTVAFSPDGATLASSAGGPLLSMALLESTTGPDTAVRLWRRTTK